MTVEAIFHLMLCFRDLQVRFAQVRALHSVTQAYGDMVGLASALETHTEMSLEQFSRLSFRLRSKDKDRGANNSSFDDDTAGTPKHPVKVPIGHCLLSLSDCARLPLKSCLPLHSCVETARVTSKGRLTFCIERFAAVRVKPLYSSQVVADERYCTPDNACLLGRIYKNIFEQSSMTVRHIDSSSSLSLSMRQDMHALDQSIHWYRTGYQTQQAWCSSRPSQH